MRRVSIAPRPLWRETVECQGLHFHTLEDGVSPYWDESACYVLSQREVDELESATYALDRMCLAAVEHVLDRNLLERFAIDPKWLSWLRESWNRDEHSIVGRFDLVYDGHGPPVMLEYNADTPTALLEAAVIQWNWLVDEATKLPPGQRAYDQFNCLHEHLIEAWTRVAGEVEKYVHFASLDAIDSVEDFMTTTYLRDTAIQAGLDTRHVAVNEIGWNSSSHRFVDQHDSSIALAFKLYPWEWMLREEFAPHLPAAKTRWLEPPWKMILSNKALLPLLYEMFPTSPYILPARYEPWDGPLVRKPFHSREGAGVSLIRDHEVIASTWDGEIGPFIYQQLRPLPEFEGRHIVFGSWMIGGYASGVGIRESDDLITGNTSRFVPHLFVPK